MSEQEAFPGSPSSDGMDRNSSVLLARVIDVDSSRHTVSVMTQQSGRRYTDIPVSNPYAHFERGEGFYVIPEVGAPCWIATEGAGASPVVLGFGTMPKVVTSETKDDPTVVPQQGDEAMPSYATRRPRRVPGEFGFTSRDGSFLHFRKGGIIELGSSGSCQRVFIPVQNHLVDVCEGYKQFTAGGLLVWDSDRGVGRPGTDAKCVWRLMARAKADDSSSGREGSVMVEAGHLGEGRFRIVVAPVGIDLKDGSYTGEVYKFEVDVLGNLVETSANVTKTCGTFDLTVNGSMTENIKGDRMTNMPGHRWTVNAESVFFHVSAHLAILGTLQLAGDLEISGVVKPAGWPGGFDLGDFATKYNTHFHSPFPPYTPDPTKLVV